MIYWQFVGVVAGFTQNDGACRDSVTDNCCIEMYIFCKDIFIKRHVYCNFVCSVHVFKKNSIIQLLYGYKSPCHFR